LIIPSFLFNPRLLKYFRRAYPNFLSLLPILFTIILLTKPFKSLQNTHNQYILRWTLSIHPLFRINMLQYNLIPLIFHFNPININTLLLILISFKYQFLFKITYLTYPLIIMLHLLNLGQFTIIKTSMIYLR